MPHRKSASTPLDATNGYWDTFTLHMAITLAKTIRAQYWRVHFTWTHLFLTRDDQIRGLCLLLMAASAIFSTALVQICAVILTVLTLSAFGRGMKFQRTPLDVPFAVFIFARLISVIVSEYPATSVRALYIEFFYYLVFFLTTQTIRVERRQIVRMVTTTLILGGVIGAMVGILKVLLTSDDRASSTTSGTYTLGAYLCAVLPLLLFRNRETPRTASLQIVAIVIIALGIVATFDRLHWIALTVLLIAAAFRRMARREVIVVTMVIATTLLIPTVRHRLANVTDTQGWSGRAVIWQGARDLADRHPLAGFGPRTFAQIFPRFDELTIRGVSSWHNDYIQIYIESGLLALLPILWLVAVTLRSGIRLLRVPRYAPSIAPLLTSTAIIFLFGGMLDTIVGIVFRIVLGMLAVLLIAPEGEPQQLAHDALLYSEVVRM
jgi:O-antigen ligase